MYVRGDATSLDLGSQNTKRLNMPVGHFSVNLKGIGRIGFPILDTIIGYDIKVQENITERIEELADKTQWDMDAYISNRDQVLELIQQLHTARCQ